MDDPGTGPSRHLRRLVGGAVVDHQDGVHGPGPLQGRQQVGQGSGLVPGGDQGDGGAGSGFPLGPVGLLGVGLLLALGILGWLPGARATPFPALGLWALAFGCYAGAAWLASGRPWTRRSPGTDSAKGGAGSAGGFGRRLTLVWGVAVAGRLLLLFLEPHLSDDIWRYLWDGHVQLQGVNPYLHAPDAGTLDPLRTSWHALVNHPSVPTIYPPGAQLVFALLAAVGSRVLVYKAAWIAADLAAAWVLGRIARNRSLDPIPVLLLYLWCPLLLVEVSWSGHLAPVALLPMMAAVWLSEKGVRGRGDAAEGGRPWAAGGALGLAAAVKFAPAAGFPALARRYGWRGGAAFALAAGLAAAPYLGAGPRLWAGLAEYVERWFFHPGPFRILELLVGSGTAKACAAAVVAGLAVRAGREGWSLERALFWTVGAALLLTPTLHPWYLLWILPFAALRMRPGWILFTGTAFLSYAHLDAYGRTGEWPQPLWLTLLIWVPPLALMGWEALTSRTGARWASPGSGSGAGSRGPGTGAQ